MNAPPENITRVEMEEMTPELLVDHLIDVGFSAYELRKLERCNVAGKHFLKLSREDIAVLFPKDDQFLLGMQLHKYIQEINDKKETIPSGSLLSDDDGQTPSNDKRIATPMQTPTTTSSFATGSQPPSGCQTPTSSRIPASFNPQTVQTPNAAPSLTQTRSQTPISFQLPKFDPDLESALQRDAFYNPNKRAKLIRKACEALAGYCRENDQVVTHSLQEGLATTLLEQAPNSLGDPVTISQDPANGLRCQIKKWFYNNSHTMRKAAGETKSKKKSEQSSPEIPDTEDEKSLQNHCKEIQKESKKSKMDYPKLFRLLQLSYAYRRQRLMEINAPMRVATNIGLYGCLKKPLLIYNEFLRTQNIQFEALEEVRQKACSDISRFRSKTIPALLEMAQEAGEKPKENATDNDKLLFGLSFIVKKLKCKKEALQQIIFICEDPSESAAFARTHTAPVLCLKGTVNEIEEMMVACEKKIVTENMDKLWFGHLVLVAVYFLYNLEYPKTISLPMTFLQEKLAGAPVTTKVGTNYTNLIRAVSLLERKFE